MTHSMMTDTASDAGAVRSPDGSGSHASHGAGQAVSAVPVSIPSAVDYLSPDKSYAVISEESGELFTIIADDGDEIDCLWDGCAHLDGGSWTRVPAQTSRQEQQKEGDA